MYNIPISFHLADILYTCINFDCHIMAGIGFYCKHISPTNGFNSHLIQRFQANTAQNASASVFCFAVPV